MRYINLVILVGLVAILGACSSWEVGSPQATLKMIAEKREAQKEKVEDTVDDIPDWYIQIPKDNDSVFSAGTAVSPNLQLAMDKGILNAKRMLADSIDGRINSMLKDYLAENGREMNPNTITDVERTTTNILKDINVSGYSIDNVEIQESGITYRTYVLLRYPLGEANRIQTKILREKALRNSRQRSKESHQELRGRTDGGT